MYYSSGNYEAFARPQKPEGVDRKSAYMGVVGVLLVQPVVLVQNADSLGLDGGDGVEQVPHDLEVVIHLPARLL